MTRHRAGILLLLVVGVLPRVAGAGGAGNARVRATTVVASTDQPSDSARVVAIADAVWARMLEDTPAIRLRSGLRVVRLPSLSVASADDDAAFGLTILARLDSVPALSVGTEAWSLATVVRWRAEAMVASRRFYWFRNPVSPYANELSGLHRIYTSWRFASAEDPERYLNLLGEYPRFIEDVTGYLRGQVRHGVVMQRDELAAAIAFVKGIRAEGHRSVFVVDSTRLRDLDPALAARFRAQVASEVDVRVNSAFDRLLSYLAYDYAAQAPTTVGLSQYPGGTEYYRDLVGRSLTFGMIPEEIHQLGLREVARLNGEMDSIRKAIRFKGTREDFHRFLRTDPRFVPKSPEAVRERMLGFVNAMTPKLGKAFAAVPSVPYDVRRLDPALEPGMTFGFYSLPTAAEPVGVYFFNGAHLEEKTSVWYEGLAYHELMPGHHFHLTLVRDQLAQLHPLRREFSSTSFSEGWAEYAAGVAGELGGYVDPYDRYGRRVMELFAATRLVLDTGMNLLGWSRERAMDYMRQNSLYSETEIASETLRYCCDIPAQALGYRMGMLKFQQLRAKTQAALGRDFDLRAFHQLVLADGPLPFTALEQRVDQYIARTHSAGR